MRVVREDELWHYGVPGMKWGHHKYVDDEGNLTEHARKKFASGMDTKHVQKQINKAENKAFKVNQKKYIEARERQDEINKLRSKAIAKSDPNKYDKKIEKLAAKRNKANEYIAKGQSFVDKIIKENNKRGYTTEETEDVKTAVTSSTGMAIVGGIIAGGFGGMILGTSTMKSLPVATRHAVVTGHPEVGENYKEPKKKKDDGLRYGPIKIDTSHLPIKDSTDPAFHERNKERLERQLSRSDVAKALDNYKWGSDYELDELIKLEKEYQKSGQLPKNIPGLPKTDSSKKRKES